MLVRQRDLGGGHYMEGVYTKRRGEKHEQEERKAYPRARLPLFRSLYLSLSRLSLHIKEMVTCSAFIHCRYKRKESTAVFSLA